jgi:hypothetical protein
MDDVLEPMAENSFTSTFQYLEKPSASPVRESEDIGVHFNAVPAPGYPNHRVGKDESGRASLLISVSSQERNPSPLRLEHLVVRHDVPCRVTNGGGSTREEKFTVITCVTPSYAPYFLRVGSSVLEELGADPTSEDVVQVVDALANLFDTFSGSRSGSLRGIWAELLVIANSNEPRLLVDAWHSTPQDRYDFNRAQQRLEVKSTSAEQPKHRFSLNQLMPPQGVDALIASLRVERAGQGLSLENLLEHVQGQLAEPERAFKVERIVAETLGSNSESAVRTSFDVEVALGSLQFFSVDKIPSPPKDLPPEVSNVRFTADLSACSDLDPEEVRRASGIFGALGSEL